MSDEGARHIDWPPPVLRYGVGELYGRSGGYQWLLRDDTTSEQDLAYLEPRTAYGQPQDTPRFALYALTDRRLAAVRCRVDVGSDTTGRTGAVQCDVWIWPLSLWAQLGGPSAWLASCLNMPLPPPAERPPVIAHLAADATNEQVWTVREDSKTLARALVAAYQWIPDDLWSTCTFDTAADGLNPRLACWINGSLTGALAIGRPIRMDAEPAASSAGNWYAQWLSSNAVRHDRMDAAFRLFTLLRDPQPAELSAGVQELLEGVSQTPMLIDAVKRLQRVASGPGASELTRWLNAHTPPPLWKRLRGRR